MSGSSGSKSWLGWDGTYSATGLAGSDKTSNPSIRISTAPVPGTGPVIEVTGEPPEYALRLPRFDEVSTKCEEAHKHEGLE